MSQTQCLPVRKTLLLTAAAVLIATPAMAQQVPDAGSILQEQRRPLPLPERLPDEAPAPPAPDISDEGPRITVRSITVEGAEYLVSEAEIQAAVDWAIGQDMGLAQLEQVAATVTAWLRDKDWPLVQAVLPPQDVTDGDIRIEVIQGHVERGGATLRMREGTRLSPARAKAMADGALPPEGATPRQGDLERAVLLLNDLPGVTAQMTLERGDEPRSTRVLIDVEQGPLLNGSLTTDTYGNRYTGAWRQSGAAAVNDPFGLGDQITAGVTAASGLRLAQAGYSMPLGSSGLSLGLAGTTMTYKIGKELAAQNNRGSATTGEARLTYPIWRTRTTTVTGSVGFSHKALTDKTAGQTMSDRRLHNWTPALSLTHFDGVFGGGLTSIQLSTTQGRLDRSRVSQDQQQDANTARSAGAFGKVNYGLVRLQTITGGVSLFAAVNGQAANGNLDSSEKFILGGPSGVRAYPVGEASGDNGWLGNVELRYDVPLAADVLRTQVVAFYDVGGVTLHHSPWRGAINTATGRNSYTLEGAGLGLNVSYSGRLSLRMSWARTIGSNPGRSVQGTNADGQRARDQFWLQGLVQF